MLNIEKLALISGEYLNKSYDQILSLCHKYLECYQTSLEVNSRINIVQTIPNSVQTLDDHFGDDYLLLIIHYLIYLFNINSIFIILLFSLYKL